MVKIWDKGSSIDKKIEQFTVGDDFIIETKGRANESFPMRWKLFKRLVMTQFPNVTLYKPQNQKECDETIKLILSKRKG